MRPLALLTLPVVLWASFAAAAPEPPAPAAPGLTAGVAVVDITPPVGYRMAGYFSERLSTGTHDPLMAKAIVLRQGGQAAALVCCDLLGLTPAVTAEARKKAEAATGIPASHILIAATHSHTGPLYYGVLRDDFHARAVAAGGSDPHEQVDYAADLIANIARAVTEANAALRPVTLAVAEAEPSPPLAFNRRFHMKDGSVRFNPGVLNPAIVGPAGPVDPQARMVLVRDAAGGRPLAALANFALHLDTTGGTLYSADYPFYAEQALRASLGREFVLVFGTGTCGDINHIDVKTKDRLKPDEIGARLAAALGQAKERLVARPSLLVRSTVVDVPLQTYTPEQLAAARERLPQIGKSGEFLKDVEACKVLTLEARGRPALPPEVQVFRLGDDAAVVGLPGEVFVELGLAIRRGSPFATTLVIELSGDDPDYIPTKKAFAEGSYETVNSIIAPGGGERLVDAALRLLKELKAAGE